MCWGHTSHWRCCALDWVSPQDGEILCQRNNAPLQDSGGLDGGGLWLLVGCQQGQRRAQSPSLLESEPGMVVGLGSTHNSLLSYSIHQDNLLFLIKNNWISARFMMKCSHNNLDYQSHINKHSSPP